MYPRGAAGDDALLEVRAVRRAAKTRPARGEEARFSIDEIDTAILDCDALAKSMRSCGLDPEDPDEDAAFVATAKGHPVYEQVECLRLLYVRLKERLARLKAPTAVLWLSAADAAAYLRFRSASGIRMLVMRGELTPIGHGPRGTLMFRREDLDAWSQRRLAPDDRRAAGRLGRRVAGTTGG